MAERFKTPVLKFGVSRPGAYHRDPKRRGLPCFLGSANVLRPAPILPVPPSSVANSVATVPDAFPADHASVWGVLSPADEHLAGVLEVILAGD